MKIIDINGYERDCVRAYPDKEWPGYMRVEFKTEVRSHHIWYPIADFIKNNPQLEELTKGAPPVIKEVVGVVSGSTDTELTDKKQKWEKDSYKDFPVWISRGKGEGQVHTVIANTSNTIIVDKEWDIKPDKTSQYVLSFDVHDPQPQGNTIPETKKIFRTKKTTAN